MPNRLPGWHSSFSPATRRIIPACSPIFIRSYRIIRCCSPSVSRLLMMRCGMRARRQEWAVFDMGRFLGYQNPQEFARQMLTHETAAHACCTKDGVQIQTLPIGSSCGLSALTRALPICLPAGRSLLPLTPPAGLRSIRRTRSTFAPGAACRIAPNRNNGCTGRKPDAIRGRKKFAAIAGLSVSGTYLRCVG